jgi:hypothetical protein
MAAYRFLINRMMSLPLTAERRQLEWQKIQTIVTNNNFPQRLIPKLKTHIQHKTQTTKDESTAPRSGKSPTSLNRPT